MTTNQSLYYDIASRTGGDIYIGVVGPVRTGKSTFIKRFMETLILPQMEDGAKKDRAKDEMPQSASGRNVMTTEPKFVPEEAVAIQMENGIGFRVKLVDCVGFPVAEAVSEEDGSVRLVNTPWSETSVPFDVAARIGTEKVIRDHSTIGIVVTTDGSIGTMKREDYLTAEADVISEMKKVGKPFAIVLNSLHPHSEETLNLAKLLEEKYGAPVLPLDCFSMNEEELSLLIRKIVLEFPTKEVQIQIPSWILSLREDHSLREEICTMMTSVFSKTFKMEEVMNAPQTMNFGEKLKKVDILSADLSSGNVILTVVPEEKLFWDILSETVGYEICSEEALLSEFSNLSEMKAKYLKIAKALEEVEESGYGIVTPNQEDMTLEEPEIVKQSGGYGVKLKASAPSIHMIRANIEAEISPIVGSERQSEDIVKYLLKEFEEEPTRIWESNLFGKSLYDLVNESLHTKLNHMPSDARKKLAETLQKIINEGSGGLICIIL